MSKTLIIIISVISLFLFRCSNTSNKKSNEQTLTASHEEQHRDDESESIELNNGEKWKVDAITITHIRNMENNVISFAKVEQKTTNHYLKNYNPNIDLLTSNCTMKGKAHDELHKWLLPYIDLVKELSETKNETRSIKQFLNIQTSFTSFNQYFQ
ncbi:MAG: hypothetical protein IPO85_12255 [Saprospiraceae bacterium]|uniref:Uncharacterized protein n=1 Tax=Candidatus Defluviibacterium haderslevense TaxID=2981993 RepID=A0A9D7SAA7_9BACT|nr:hypothetical protein [Candidatus Defluviibacterium haderslevense]